MPLTDTEIRTAKPGPRQYKISDGGWLFLLVTPSGSKLWRMAYRFDGKEKTLSFGPYPTVSLRDARERRDAAKAMVLAGKDPGQQKKIEKLARAASNATTFAGIADEYVEKLRHEGRAQATLDKVVWLLSLVKPKLGGRPISDIKAPEVLAILKSIEGRGNLETAKRLRDAIDPDGDSAVCFDVKNRRQGSKKEPDPSLGETFALDEAGKCARSLVKHKKKRYKEAVYIAGKTFGFHPKTIEKEYGKQKALKVPIQPLSFFTGGPVSDEEIVTYRNAHAAWVNERYSQATQDEIRAEAREILKSDIKDVVRATVRDFIKKFGDEAVGFVVEPLAQLFGSWPRDVQTDELADELLAHAAESLAQRLLEDTEKHIANKIKEHLVAKTIGPTRSP